MQTYFVNANLVGGIQKIKQTSNRNKQSAPFK